VLPFGAEPSGGEKFLVKSYLNPSINREKANNLKPGVKGKRNSWPRFPRGSSIGSEGEIDVCFAGEDSERAAEEEYAKSSRRGKLAALCARRGIVSKSHPDP